MITLKIDIATYDMNSNWFKKKGLASQIKHIEVLTCHELNWNRLRRSQLQQGIRKTSMHKPAKQIIL